MTGVARITGPLISTVGATLDRLDHATRASRERAAVSVFYGHAPSWGDRLASGAYFAASAHMWGDLGLEAGHRRALEVGLGWVEGFPRRALDICTGAGAGAAVVAARFPAAEVMGVDISRRMLREASRRYRSPNLKFVRADALALPVADGSTDLITVLNAVSVPVEICRVLAPRGTVIVAGTWSAIQQRGLALEHWERAGLRLARAEDVDSGGAEMFVRA